MPRPIKLALITETFTPEVNGVAMTLGRLAAGIEALDHRLQIIRPRQQHERTGLNRQNGRHELLTPGLPLPGYAEVRFGLPCSKRLREFWCCHPPDIVHIATEGPLGFSALSAAQALDLPVISTFHTNFHTYSHHYGLGWLQGNIERYLRWFHNRTLATLVPTQALAWTLAARGFRNVDVLSRGVDTRLFDPLRRSTELRASWGARHDTPVVMVVGRLAAEKNLNLALRAYTALRKHQPQAQIVFVGDGPLRESLARAHPDCHFVGNRHGEDLARHYASADLFLFPSLTETFGNVVSEALASGLPVIGFDYAACSHLITDGINGLRIPPGNEAAFISATINLGDVPQRLMAMRPACVASVRHLEWNRIYRRYESLLQRAVREYDVDSQAVLPIRFVPD